MVWRRRSQAKPGVPFIDDRAALEVRNRPVRLAAEAKAAKAKPGQGKKKKKS